MKTLINLRVRGLYIRHEERLKIQEIHSMQKRKKWQKSWVHMNF